MFEVREEATVGTYETRTPVSPQHENIAIGRLLQLTSTNAQSAVDGLSNLPLHPINAFLRDPSDRNLKVKQPLPYCAKHS